MNRRTSRRLRALVPQRRRVVQWHIGVDRARGSSFTGIHTVTLTAGGKILAGEPVYIGEDGRVYSISGVISADEAQVLKKFLDDPLINKEL